MSRRRGGGGEAQMGNGGGSRGWNRGIEEPPCYRVGQMQPCCQRLALGIVQVKCSYVVQVRTRHLLCIAFHCSALLCISLHCFSLWLSIALHCSASALLRPMSNNHIETRSQTRFNGRGMRWGAKKYIVLCWTQERSQDEIWLTTKYINTKYIWRS